MRKESKNTIKTPLGNKEQAKYAQERYEQKLAMRQNKNNLNQKQSNGAQA